MTTPGAQTPLIVVGVSSRTGSPAALRWAADNAAQLGGRVRAVMAWRPPRPPAAPGVHPPVVASTDVADPERQAADHLAAVVAEALGPDHQVECVARHGATIPVLVAAAEDAVLLVLDSPRPTKLNKMSAKLVAPQLVFRAPCPVVVMPPPPLGGGGGLLRQVSEKIATAAVSAAGSAGRPGLIRVPPPPPEPPA